MSSASSSSPGLWPGLLLLGVCAGCSSFGGPVPIQDPRLPYHVAVVGVASQAAEAAPGGVAASGDPPMRLAADNHLLSTLLARELAQRAFTRATAIVLPEGGDLQQLRQAVLDSGADMVLLSDLDYSAPISYERTSSVVLNVALFLVGGPFIWFLDEYTYHARAELKVSLYDLRGVDSAAHAPGDPEALILEGEARFEGVQTDFTDRVRPGSEGAALSYLATVFTSTFLVGQEGDQVAEMVSRRALASLGEQISEIVLARRDDVQAARSPARLADISIDSQWLAFDDSGYLDMRIKVSLHSADGRQRLQRCRVTIGDRVEEWALGEGSLVGEGAAAARSYEVRLLVPDVDDGTDTFNVALMGGSGDQELRSYTLAVPSRDDDD